MKKSTRILSLLLVLVMVFALMPTFTVEAKAASTFYGSGATAGSATNVTWYGKETLKDSNNNDVKIMQYANTAYSGEPINRHDLNTGSSINMTITAHGNRFVFLIPYNSGVIYLDKENENGNNPIKKHLVNSETSVNRWWRWDSWSGSDTEWTTDSTTAGFFARVCGAANTWHDIIKSHDERWSWKSNKWTGGASDNTGKNLDIRINANANLPVGSKGVMWNANGSKLNNNGDVIEKTYLHIEDEEWVDNGTIGVSEFVIAEPKEVVYELNGGTLNGQTGGNIGYICWNTNDKVTSQLHDIIGEPTRDDGYKFVGWECVSTEGTTVANAKVTKEHVVTGNQDNKTELHPERKGEVGYDKYNVTNEGSVIEKGKVYQTKDQNGKATTLTVLGNVVFRAKWVKATSKIAHVQKNAETTFEDLKLADFGSYKVVAFDKEKEFSTNSYTLDITTKVSTGYLYGGTFKEEACTTVADFNGGTADSFVPKFTEKGETYYIWEVTNEHLQPTVLSTYSNNGGYKVEQVFLVSAVDRDMYQEAGFMLNNNPDSLIKTYDNKLYSTILIKSQKDSSATLEANYAKLNSKNTTAANALLSCAEINVPTSETSVVPYWVTLDGQTVYGVKQCAISYSGSGPALKVNFSAYPTVDKAFAPVRSFAAAPMMLMSTYSMGQEESPAEIPGAPEVPETPDVPDEPDEPDIPDEPEVKAMLNIVDGENAYEVEITDDLALTPAGVDGKLFGGWFADKACTVPADISKAQDGNTVYAKYVSDKYLQVKYNAVFTLLSKSISLTSAVDSKDYAETGYVISTKGGDKTVVVSKYATTFALQNAKQLFGVEKNAPLMNVDYKLSGLSKNDTVTVTPYLVTADGTTVYGTARTLTYTGLTVKG